MDVGVYNIKFNRPMYSVMCTSFVKGLERHGVKCYLYNTASKNFIPKESHDLAVVFTNAPRSKIILEKQKENKNKFLTMYIGALSKKGVVNFRNRNEIFGWDTKTKPTEDALIHCDLLSNDYMTSNYYRGSPKYRLEKLNHFGGVELKPWKDEGYVLIPEQIHPEGMGHGVTDWLTWAQETCKQIRSLTDRPIKIRRHPNRKAWKDYRQTIKEEFKDVHFSDGIDCPLEEDLNSAHSIVTISSRCVIEGVINGSNPFTRDLNSLAWSVSNSIGMIHSPIRFDRSQWLRDLAYCHWGLDEIANGDCWNFLKRSL